MEKEREREKERSLGEEYEKCVCERERELGMKNEVVKEGTNSSQRDGIIRDRKGEKGSTDMYFL